MEATCLKGFGEGFGRMARQLAKQIKRNVLNDCWIFAPNAHYFSAQRLCPSDGYKWSLLRRLYTSYHWCEHAQKNIQYHQSWTFVGNEKRTNQAKRRDVCTRELINEPPCTGRCSPLVDRRRALEHRMDLDNNRVCRLAVFINSRNRSVATVVI